MRATFSARKSVRGQLEVPRRRVHGPTKREQPATDSTTGRRQLIREDAHVSGMLFVMSVLVVLGGIATVVILGLEWLVERYRR